MSLLAPKNINLIKEFSVSWFKLRDQRAVLGLLWSFLNPLIMTTILYFLFKSRLQLDNDRTYFLYILIGSVAWNFFSITIEEGTRSITGRAHMVRNVVFPKAILVFSQVGSTVIQHAFELLVVIIFIFIFGVGLSPLIFLFPIVIMIECALITGISLFLACLNTFARDIEHIWTVVNRMLFFLVPIFYKAESLSPQFRWIVTINPMTQIINFYRDIFLYQRFPSLKAICFTTFFSLCICFLGYKFFKHYEYKIVEKV